MLEYVVERLGALGDRAFFEEIHSLKAVGTIQNHCLGVKKEIQLSK